uniref:Zinc finger protein 512B n=1 Tax=Astyanax mexicanus TaxID=7994 RepID=A0A8B9K5I9_ASTMX
MILACQCICILNHILNWYVIVTEEITDFILLKLQTLSVSVFVFSASGPSCNERSEGKKKGRPRVDVQELRSIPAHMMVQWKEEFKSRSRVKCPNSGCWVEFPSIYGLKYHYQRCHGNNPPSPVFFKVKKTQEASQPSQNGECATQKSERKQHHSSQQQQQQQQQQQGAASDTGGSESEGGSLPPPFPEEDPERMKHRRKQKTPKKFTGEQPSISGTFGLKGMNKVEEKLKAGRVKRPEGALFNEESPRKQTATGSSRRKPPSHTQAPAEAQWQHTISERGEVSCPTCSVVTRKTVHGLKKHMDICQKLQDALKCQQCHKQFRSKADLSYHTMTEHSAKPSGSENEGGDEQEEREKLRRVLKQMGSIKCPSEGCTAHFTSLMGYQYHQKRCGRELSDTEKPVFLCQHCGKTYRSKAGRDYHVRSEHAIATTPTRPEVRVEAQDLLDLDRTPSGRVRRRSAQVAVFHLQEIAEDELAKDWGTKRRIKDDLVPDIKRLNYTRPGLPNFSPETLETWKNEVKEKGFICCPNISCEAVYSSVSGLKAHLANCNKGGGDVGKYTCLLCQKEFSSESGVKYHISKTHSQVSWKHIQLWKKIKRPLQFLNQFLWFCHL